MENTRKLMEGLETALDEEKWVKGVETKWSPPEGFFKQDAGKIASGLMSASKDKAQAMERLNFYINRAGKNLSDEDKSRLEDAKKKLSAMGEDVEEISEAKAGAASVRLIKSKTDFLKKQAGELQKAASEMQSVSNKAGKAGHWAIANGMFHVAARVEDYVRRALNEVELAMDSLPGDDASDSVMRDWAIRVKDGYYR